MTTLKDIVFGDAHPLDAVDDSDVPPDDESGDEEDEDTEDVPDP